jgi:hypothetical protein
MAARSEWSPLRGPYTHLAHEGARYGYDPQRVGQLMPKWRSPLASLAGPAARR